MASVENVAVFFSLHSKLVYKIMQIEKVESKFLFKSDKKITKEKKVFCYQNVYNGTHLFRDIIETKHTRWRHEVAICLVGHTAKSCHTARKQSANHKREYGRCLVPIVKVGQFASDI